MLMILGAFVLVNPTAALVVTVYFAVMVVTIQWLIGTKLKQIGRDVNQGVGFCDLRDSRFSREFPRGLGVKETALLPAPLQ